MTDLRSRADELIDSAIEDARAETFNPSKYTREQAKETPAARPCPVCDTTDGHAWNCSLNEG